MRKRTPGKFPTKLRISPKRSVIVRQESMEDVWGYWDPEKREIVINSDQEEEGKWMILMHEMMHLIEDELLSRKVITHRVNHQFVNFGSCLLFQYMALNDMLTDISKQDILRFLEDQRMRRYK